MEGKKKKNFTETWSCTTRDYGCFWNNVPFFLVTWTFCSSMREAEAFWVMLRRSYPRKGRSRVDTREEVGHSFLFRPSFLLQLQPQSGLAGWLALFFTKKNRWVSLSCPLFCNVLWAAWGLFWCSACLVWWPECPLSLPPLFGQDIKTGCLGPLRRWWLPRSVSFLSPSSTLLHIELHPATEVLRGTKANEWVRLGDSCGPQVSNTL